MTSRLSHFYFMVLLISTIAGNLAEETSGYKVSHKPGQVKIHANPDGAEFEYSGGDLDVNIRPPSNEVTSILNFYNYRHHKHENEAARMRSDSFMNDDFNGEDGSTDGHFYESRDEHPTIIEGGKSHQYFDRCREETFLPCESHASGYFRFGAEHDIPSHMPIWIANQPFNSDKDTLGSGNYQIKPSGNNDAETFIEHSGYHPLDEMTGSYRNRILPKYTRKHLNRRSHRKTKKGTKKQLWRKPFDFHGSILARFKQHWAEEEQANKDEFNDDYEADRKFEEQRANRHRYHHGNAADKDVEEKYARPTSEELMRNVNTPKKIYPSEEAIHGSGDGGYKPNPKQHDDATSRHEFTDHEEIKKIEEEKKKKEEEEKKKKKKKALEEKKASKAAADKAYSSIQPIDDDEGPDDPPDSRTKPTGRGELHWDEEMPENVTSSTEDETNSKSKSDAPAPTTTTPKPSEDAMIQVPAATTTANGSSDTDKKETEHTAASSEDAYSTIKEKEPTGNLLPPDPNETPYGMAKPKDPVVSPPTPMSDLPPQYDEGHGSQMEKPSRSDKMNLGGINSEAELPDQLEHETGKGFRPPANWYNKMPAQDRMNHEFHEQLMDHAIAHGPKHYKDIEPPHEGVEKFGNDNEEIDINDRTREGDVDEEEVERRMHDDKNDLPTQDSDEMNKLSDLDDSYNREHHRRRNSDRPRHYHQRDEEYPDSDDLYNRDEKERLYERRHQKRPDYSPDDRDDAYQHSNHDLDDAYEHDRLRNSHHRQPEYDDEDDEEGERKEYDRDNERLPFENEKSDDRAAPYSRPHSRQRSPEMEMDEYSDEIRPKQTSEYTPKHAGYSSNRPYHNDASTKPLTRHFNFDTGEVDDPAAAAEDIASVIENKPNSPYSMFRNKFDETSALQGADYAKKHNREQAEQMARQRLRPQEQVGLQATTSRENLDNSFLQNQYKQMFNKLDNKASFSVSQQGNNPLLSAPQTPPRFEPKQFSPKMSESPNPGEKVDPEVKSSNLDGLFKEKVDQAPEIKSAEQAENLMNQMQELALKNQKLLDSPEAVTTRNNMDLASNDMPPLTYPGQGSTPLVGGKKHTIQHNTDENLVSKKRKKRHKSSAGKLNETKSRLDINKTLNSTSLTPQIESATFDEMLTRITKKLERSLKQSSKNKTLPRFSSLPVEKYSNTTATGTRKDTASVNSTVNINISGLNRDNNGCKKCSLNKRNNRKSRKTIFKNKSNKTKLNLTPTRKDNAAVNSSVSINITGLNSPNVNYQTFIPVKIMNKNHLLLKNKDHSKKLLTPKNKTIFTKYGKNSAHSVPIRKDTASVNSSVSINITGLNSPNVNCQTFLPAKNDGQKVNKNILCRSKKNNSLNHLSNYHEDRLVNQVRRKVKKHEKTLTKKKGKKLNFLGRKENPKTADRRNTIKDMTPNLLTIETFYNPHSTRTISQTIAKTVNKRKELILNSFFSKSHDRVPVSRMNKGGRALASRRNKDSDASKNS